MKGASNKIRAHNGCIIADSVGLGKTCAALAVIKYFELRNDKVRNPARDKDGQPKRKVLLFTAFAATSAYLYESLVTWAHAELGIHAATVITHTFRKRNAGNLLSGRGGTLVKRDRQVSATTDFELITWLVVR